MNRVQRTFTKGCEHADPSSIYFPLIWPSAYEFGPQVSLADPKIRKDLQCTDIPRAARYSMLAFIYRTAQNIWRYWQSTVGYKHTAESNGINGKYDINAKLDTHRTISLLRSGFLSCEGRRWSHLQSMGSNRTTILSISSNQRKVLKYSPYWSIPCNFPLRMKWNCKGRYRISVGCEKLRVFEHVWNMLKSLVCWVDHVDDRWCYMFLTLVNFLVLYGFLEPWVLGLLLVVGLSCPMKPAAQSFWKSAQGVATRDMY